MSVTIIDYGMGNLRSVRNAVDAVGYDPVIATSADEVLAAERLILPGVGAFGKAAENLSARGLTEAIRQRVAEGCPMLGICLGMQMLATSGEESGGAEGLNLIPGVVVPFPDDPEHPVPHVGWNNSTARRSHPLLEGIKPGVDFYFVHSFYFRVEESEAVLLETEYGLPFVAGVAKDNVVGFQFHPEKSQKGGLQILENFCEWDGTC